MDVIKMKLKNKKLIAVFVVPVVIIAAVAGYYLYEDEEPLRIEEGYAEMTVTVPPYPEMESYNETTTATTYINGKNNSLELTVHPMFWKISFADIRISIESMLEPDFEPTNVIIQAKILDAPDINQCGIVFAFIPDLENLTPWPHSKNSGPVRGERVCFVGYDVTERNFQINDLKLMVEYPTIDYNMKSLESPITVEVTAILRGLSEEVISTVQITYSPNGGDM